MWPQSVHDRLTWAVEVPAKGPKRNRDHLIIPLLGRLKDVLNSQYHLAQLAAVTDSGLAVRKWDGRMVVVQEKEGRMRGPAFGDRHGNVGKVQRL